MANKLKGNPSHRWFFDYPWEMVDLRDWFYMVNAGFLEHQVFLHVRFLGIRSRWVYDTLPDRSAEQRNEAVDAGQDCPLCHGTGYKSISPTILAECKHNATGQS